MPVDWDAEVLAPNFATFAESATYLPANAPAFSFMGVFDEAFRDVSNLDPLEANTVMPVIGVRLSQMAVMPQQNDQVRVASVNRLYFVVDVRPDGHGWAKLFLGDTKQS
jgi:hypothetical protein